MTDDTDTPTSTDDILRELNAWLRENWDPNLSLGRWWDRLGRSGGVGEGKRHGRASNRRQSTVVAERRISSTPRSYGTRTTSVGRGAHEPGADD